MEDFLVWLVWAAIIGGSIASSASKAKKKRQEDARRAAAGQGSSVQAPAGDASADRGIVPSCDRYPFETEYDAADGRGREPERRQTVANAKNAFRATGIATTGVAAQTGSRQTDVDAAATGLAEADDLATGDDTRARLAEIIGGEFDLRRAIIEAEILSPKYIRQ